MTAPLYLTRAQWGADPVVRSSNGSPRAKLVNPSTWLTVHYTGNQTPLYTPTRDAVIAAQQSLERFAAGQDKPNEYNWCLYDADGAAVIVEYAGQYVAAHSAGENDRAVGVLFYVGVGQAVPDTMVDAYRYLRDVMLPAPVGTYGPATAQTPHRDMPGAATPCPGPVLDRWGDLLAPYTNGGPDVTRMLVRCGNDPTGPKDTAWNAYVVHDGGKYWIPTNEAIAIVSAELGSPIDVPDDWMRAHGPVIGPNPALDPWGAWTPLPD